MAEFSTNSISKVKTIASQSRKSPATLREDDKRTIIASRSRRYIFPRCLFLHRRLREYPWPRGAGIAKPSDREEKVISVSKRLGIDRVQNTG